MSPKSGVRGSIDRYSEMPDFSFISNEQKLITGTLEDGRIILIPDAAIDFCRIRARIAFLSRKSVGIDLRNQSKLIIKKSAIRISGVKKVFDFKEQKLQDGLFQQSPWYSDIDGHLLHYDLREFQSNVDVIVEEKLSPCHYLNVDDIVISFDHLYWIDYQQLMGIWVAPLQSFISILTQRFESVLAVYAMISIDGKDFACEVYGESIVNMSDKSETSSSAVKMVSPLEFVEKLSTWRQNLLNPSGLFNVYGQLMLAEENLTRMRFLLLIEGLESHYDIQNKEELLKKDEEFQERRNTALSFLKKLQANSDEERRIIEFIKGHLFSNVHIPLSQKLEKLFDVIPEEVIVRMASIKTIERYAEATTADRPVRHVCCTLGRLRNALSHGDDKAYGHDFPLLVNKLEGIVQYLMLCEIGFDPNEIKQALLFSGFPPPKHYGA